MKTTQRIAAAAIALLGSTAAFAQNSEIDLQHFGAAQSSAVTRAEVRAEVLRANASGDLSVPSEVTAWVVPAATSTVNVQAQRAEVRAAVARGELGVPAEVTASATPTGSSVSRDAVRAEARAQARAGYQDLHLSAGY